MEFSRILGKNKVLNRVAGGLLKLFFLGVRKLRSFSRVERGRVLVVALNRLGDAVFTIPAAGELVLYYKKNITILCYPETKEIYQLVFKDINYLTLTHEDFHFTGRVPGSAARKLLSDFNPEIIYDLTGNVTSAMLILYSGAKEIIGINKEIYRNIYTKFTPIRKRPHLSDVYLDAIYPQVQAPGFHLPAFSEYSNKEGYILVHPFAGWKAKEWGMEKFIKLTEALSEEYKCAMVFPDNNTNSCTIETLNNIVFFKTKTVAELIGVIKGSSAFIGNDSGPLYIASLLGKPTFTIYGPTNPEFSQPKGGHHTYIRKIIGCSPGKGKQYCFTNAGRSGCPSFECMNQLTIEEVYQSAVEFLKNAGVHRKTNLPENLK